MTSQSLFLIILREAKLFSLSRTKVYELIAFEELLVIRFGRAIHVSPTALEKFLKRREKSIPVLITIHS